MSYTRIKIRDDLMILRSGDNRYLFMSIASDPARILFSEDDEELLKYAECEAELAGKKDIVYDFFSEYEGTGKILKKSGYEIVNGPKVLAVNTAELFDSSAVKKSLESSFPDARFIPFWELKLYQMTELLNFFDTHGIPLERESISVFDEDLSGIVYDGNGRIRAFILVSGQENDLVIEGLFSTAKNDSEYLLTALRGFANAMLESDNVDFYDRIIMIEINQTIKPLLRRLLDKKYEITELGTVLEARKNDIDVPVVNEKYATESIFEKKNAAFEIDSIMNDIKLQRNINWKIAWNMASEKKEEETANL